MVGRIEALTGQPLDVRSFDLTDRDKTEATFVDTQIDAVIHFAGFKAVGQSVSEPLAYYENNLDTTLSLLRAMDRHGVRTLVFSRLGDGLRRDAGRADDRGGAHVGDQPLRLDQGHERAGPARHGRGRPDVADRAAALLQPGRRPPQRHDG